MLQFRDCPHCGKRIRIEANRCHRCNENISSVVTLDEVDPTEHVATGGYNTDDFDYDDFVAEEFDGRIILRKRFWFYVTWLMIIVMLLTSFAIFSAIPSLN